MSKDQDDKEVSKTNSGVRAEGDLDSVAETAEEAEKVMKTEKVSEDSINDFNDWRPRTEDEKDDLKQKTVDKASIDTKKPEEKAKGFKKDISEASQKAKNSVKKEETGKEVLKASETFANPFLSQIVGLIRKTEKTLYSKLMLKFNPYFFDSGDLSADIEEKRNGKYKMDINISEKETREAVQENLGKED